MAEPIINDRYLTIDVSASSTDQETLTDVLADIGRKNRTVKKVKFQPSTTDDDADFIRGRLYVNQTQVIDYSQLTSFARPVTSYPDNNARIEDNEWLNLDLKLTDGDSLQTGFFTSTPGSISNAGKVMFQYKDD